MPAPYRITGPAFDRESICVGCQGCSGGWDGGLWYAPAAPHPGGGQAPALHFSPSMWFVIADVRMTPYRGTGPAFDRGMFGWLGRGIVVCAGCAPPRRGTSPRDVIGSTARVSALGVKDVRVAGTGDCGMRRLRPTQAGDKPPRYILSPASAASAYTGFRRTPEWRQRGCGCAKPICLNNGS